MNKPELVKAAKFALVGASNTLVDMGLFALLAQVLGWNLYLSQVISYSAGTANSYIWNRRWTFRSRERFWSPVLVRFLLVNLAMLAFSTALLWFFHSKLGFARLVAKCASVVLTLAANFVINRLWVFSS